jgi:hypothetical protein
MKSTSVFSWLSELLLAETLLAGAAKAKVYTDIDSDNIAAPIKPRFTFQMVDVLLPDGV